MFKARGMLATANEEHPGNSLNDETATSGSNQFS